MATATERMRRKMMQGRRHVIARASDEAFELCLSPRELKGASHVSLRSTTSCAWQPQPSITMEPSAGLVKPRFTH